MNLTQLLEKISNIPIAGKTIPKTKLTTIWNSICGSVDKQISMGKAVNIQGLGLFSFLVEKIDVGTTGQKVILHPVFVLADRFSRCFNASMRKQYATGTLPQMQLNVISVAMNCGEAKEVVHGVLQEIILHIGEAVKHRQSVDIDFGFGKFSARSGQCSFRYNPAFTDRAQAVSDSRRSPALRVGSRYGARPGSAMSRGFSPSQSPPPAYNQRPMSANSNASRGSRRSASPAQRNSPSISPKNNISLDVSGVGRASPAPSSRQDSRRSQSTGRSRSSYDSNDSFELFQKGRNTQDQSWASFAHECSGNLCKVCRLRDMQVMRKRVVKSKEEAHDRILTEEYMRESIRALEDEKNKEKERIRAAREVQAFNYRKLQEKEAGSRRGIPPANEEVGNLFETRQPPPGRALDPEEYSRSLRDQVEHHRQRKEREIQAERDFYRNQRAIVDQQVKDAEDAERQALREKQRQQYKALEDQMKFKQDRIPYAQGTAEDPRFDSSSQTKATEEKRREQARRIKAEMEREIYEREKEKRRLQMERAQEDRNQIETLKKELDEERQEHFRTSLKQKALLRDMWEEQIREREIEGKKEKIREKRFYDTSLVFDEDSKLGIAECERCHNPLPEGISITPAVKKKMG